MADNIGRLDDDDLYKEMVFARLTDDPMPEARAWKRLLQQEIDARNLASKPWGAA
jgi:hypothetical protein